MGEGVPMRIQNELLLITPNCEVSIYWSSHMLMGKHVCVSSAIFDACLYTRGRENVKQFSSRVIIELLVLLCG